MNFLYDFMHLLPTILLTIVIMAILYFTLRKRKYGKLLTLLLGLSIGFLLYLNGDACLNSKRYYKKHKAELWQIVSLYRKTSDKMHYNVWYGGYNVYNIEAYPKDTTWKPSLFVYNEFMYKDEQNDFIRKSGIDKGDMEQLIELLIKTGCKEITRSVERGQSDLNVPFVIAIAYKYSRLPFTYHYRFNFSQNGYQDPGEIGKVDTNVYFYRMTQSINGN